MTAPALYVRDGSRFVLHNPRAQHTPPIPVPVSLSAPEAPQEPREGTGGRFYPVPAPRCPHGHFARWAARHCRGCR